MRQMPCRYFAKETKPEEKEAANGPAEEKKEAAPKKEDTKQQKKKVTEDTSSSSDEENGSTLSQDDVKQIKKLISEQEAEIDKLKEQTKQLKEKLVYQLAENDNTIKRYKKEIDSTREYAISKFAKDLLDVRDNLERASEHIKSLKIEEQNDIAELKKYFEQIQKGMDMTSHVMD